MKLKTLFSALAVMGYLTSVHAELHTEAVEYKDGDTVLEGYLAYDDALATGKRPGILIVHQWTGLGDYEKKRAEMLAKLGYVAFAADIYGKGVRPAPKDAGAEATKYKSNRPLLRQRVNAGLEVLKKNERTDTTKVGAIGYCFGGTTVIELARSGADLAGVVSFHGGLDSPTPADGKNIKCKVLACHGADDPFVPATDLAAFESEMRDAKVDWRLIKYGGAVHSFTDWGAKGAMKGAAYNERADKHSWADMQNFFNEIFSTN